MLNSTPEQMLIYLKMRGPQPASALAKEFGITNEGARLHLKKLMSDKLVEPHTESNGVGRPKVLYGISNEGLKHFPDTHGELSVQLVASIKHILGEEALDKVIHSREEDALKRYTEALQGRDALEDKLESLSRIRSLEGYMAEWEKNDEGYLFVENHCPICEAAQVCNGFCHSELRTFQKALGKGVKIERKEHIVKGERRCCYKVMSAGL